MLHPSPPAYKTEEYSFQSLVVFQRVIIQEQGIWVDNYNKYYVMDIWWILNMQIIDYFKSRIYGMQSTRSSQNHPDISIQLRGRAFAS